jgi:branched-chain amino acid transport system permease protein
MSKLWTRVQEWVKSYFSLVVLTVPILLYTAWVDSGENIVLTSISTVMFINLILVMSLQVFMGNSGVANFSHPAFMLIGAYASILFTLTPEQKSFTLPDMPISWWIHGFHVPFLPALLIAGLIAAVIGGLIGIPMIPIGRTAFGFGSFALLIIIRAVAVNADKLTRGTRTVVGITRYTTLWNSCVWALLTIVAAYLFKQSGLGLKLRASREDERAGASIGINIVRCRLVAWMFGCFLAAISGGLWAHRITTLTPHAFWFPLSFLALMMLVVGGRASVSGAVVGTVAITLISEGVRMGEYALNINRESIPLLAAVFPSQIVGLTEFVLSIVLLFILYRRPSGIVGEQELKWPFGKREPKRALAQVASAAGRVVSDPASPESEPGDAHTEH